MPLNYPKLQQLNKLEGLDILFSFFLIENTKIKIFHKPLEFSKAILKVE